MQGLGLHSHDDHAHHDHAHGDGSITVELYLWKMLCATLVVWAFLILQILLQWINSVMQHSKVHLYNDTFVFHGPTVQLG